MSGDAFGPWPGDPGGGGGTTGGDGGNTTPAKIDATPPWGASDLDDQMTLAGVILPGLVRYEGEIGRKLDVKNAKGSDGATITDDGSDPETLEFMLLMWNEDQWKRYFSEALPLINPNSTKGKLTPVDVAHPVLAAHGIKRVYVEKMTLPKPGKIPQTKEVTIRLRGWRPEPVNPKSKSNTPDKSAGSGWYEETKTAGSGWTEGNNPVAGGAEKIKEAYSKDSKP
jgi:hypothetical protein